MSPITSHHSLPLLRPEEPRDGNQHLEHSGYPEIKLHPPRRLADIPSYNRANQYTRKCQRAPVPLYVFRQRCRQLRVRGQIAQHGREHHARDLRHAQRAAPDDLPRGLEAEQRDGDLVPPHDVRAEGVEGAVDDAGLDDGGDDEDDGGLQGEGGDEGAAAQGARVEGQAGEEEAAEAEAEDGGEGFGPAVGLGGRFRGGGAEAEEDGVARLHADEGAVGVVDCAVDEAGDEGAGEHDEGGVGGGDVLVEVGEEAGKEGEGLLAGAAGGGCGGGGGGRGGRGHGRVGGWGVSQGLLGLVARMPW